MRRAIAALMLACVLLIALMLRGGLARDNGQYAQSQHKEWFDQLKSKRGLCCSDADGTAISDADWEVVNGKYRVRIKGQWVDVPDDALITEPNKVGRTMVWPIDIGDKIVIRCFMPGAMI